MVSPPPMVPADDPRLPAMREAWAPVLKGASLQDLARHSRESWYDRALLHIADTMRPVPPPPSFPFTVGLLMRLARDGAASTSDAQTALAEIEGRL